METSVLIALITSFSSLGLNFFNWQTSYRTNTNVERLKSNLATQQAEQDAERDYKYEARKRLYQECEPLLFQLIESSETALNQIKYIASRVNAKDGHVFREHYNLKTAVYQLLLPSAIFKMIRKRLTLVDLQVDDMIYTQYILAKAVYFCYTDDFNIARSEIGKELEYRPYVDDWREKRKQNPQVYRRQGFPLGRLDNALDALINNEEKSGYSFISFGEFEEKFDAVKEDDVKSSLGTAKDIFFKFHPDTRPILWRILIAQALLYQCILEVSQRRRMTLSEILELIKSLREEEIIGNPFEQRIDNNIIGEPFEVAKAYLDRHLKEQLRLLKTISARK